MPLVNDDILPPHPIVELPLPMEVFIRWGLLAFLALILGTLVVWWIWRRFRSKQHVETPYERCVKILNAVKQEIFNMSDRSFAFAISACVRDYLEVAFDLPAPERTTEEFLANLNQYELFRSPDVAYLLKQILEKCDEAKFAQRCYLPAEKEELYKYALEFVERLHEKEQLVSPEGQKLKSKQPVKNFSKPLTKKAPTSTGTQTSTIHKSSSSDAF